MRTVPLYITLVLITNALSAQFAPDTIAAAYTTATIEVVGSATSDQRLFATAPAEQEKMYGLRAQHDLGTMLERTGIARMSYNGPPGSAATARFGGFSSDHSAILWNGIPLNALSLGTCDISLIPAFFLDEAVLYRNPSVSEKPLSGLGITLDMQSQRSAPQGGFVRLLTGYNSMRNTVAGIEQYHRLFKAIDTPADVAQSSFRVLDVTWRTRAMVQDMKNEFQYRDNYLFDTPNVQQMHNNARSGAMLNDITVRTTAGEFSIHHWYGSRSAMLPALMGKYAPGTAEQEDELNRSLLRWSLRRNKISAEVSSSWFAEKLFYRDNKIDDDRWLINSLIRSRSLLNKVVIKMSLNRAWSAGFHVTQAWQHVSNTNYSEGGSGMPWTLAGGHFTWSYNGMRIIIDAQQDTRNLGRGPSTSLSFSYRNTSTRLQYKPYATIARKFRQPDMNELFWVPGGNPSLRAESSLAVSGGIDFSYHISDRVLLTVAPAAHHAMVTDWIQWIPTDAGYWTPVNYRSVRSLGAELPLAVDAERGSRKLRAETRLIFTRAEIFSPAAGDGAQMIYTPQITQASAVGFFSGSLDLSFRHRYMSARFTDEQNSALRMLPAYQVMGVAAGYSFTGGNIECNLAFDIDNLFNVRYESVRSYAIPGRVISLNLTTRINTMKKISFDEK